MQFGISGHPESVKSFYDDLVCDELAASSAAVAVVRKNVSLGNFVTHTGVPPSEN
jgi:hypothetical protein